MKKYMYSIVLLLVLFLSHFSRGMDNEVKERGPKDVRSQLKRFEATKLASLVSLYNQADTQKSKEDLLHAIKRPMSKARVICTIDSPLEYPSDLPIVRYDPSFEVELPLPQRKYRVMEEHEFAPCVGSSDRPICEILGPLEYPLDLPAR